MLELEQGKRARRCDFASAAELSAHLKHSSRAIGPHNCRIYIIEGLAPDFIAALGDHFLMDPTFFIGQERTTRWGLSFEGSRNTPELPSLVDSAKSFTMKYYEPRNFGEIETISMWCARTSRNISVTRNTRPDLYDLKYEPVGIVHRKCSFWSQKLDNTGWDGEQSKFLSFFVCAQVMLIALLAVILCDPPVDHVLMQVDHPNIDTATRSKYSRDAEKSNKAKGAEHSFLRWLS
jgi:hypothetical protein